MVKFYNMIDLAGIASRCIWQKKCPSHILSKSDARSKFIREFAEKMLIEQMQRRAQNKFLKYQHSWPSRQLLVVFPPSYPLTVTQEDKIKEHYWPLISQNTTKTCRGRSPFDFDYFRYCHLVALKLEKENSLGSIQEFI